MRQYYYTRKRQKIKYSGDDEMSLTAKEFDKAIKINEEIEEVKGCIRKLENHHAASFDLAWGNMYSFMNEEVEIPRELECEIVQRIYEWYKSRLEQAEDEFSKLVTRE